MNPTPLKGSAFQFIPAFFRSLWFLIICAGMIPATMAAVAKGQKELLWKGVQFAAITFVVLSAGFLISTIMSTSSSPSEVISSPGLAPWDPIAICEQNQGLKLELLDQTNSPPGGADKRPAIYSPNASSTPSIALQQPERSSGIVSTTTGVKNGMRRLLIDSGANILLAPNDNNMTNITKKTYMVTGVHGTSPLDYVGRLPTLVTNMGDQLHFEVECPINLTNTDLKENRTIVAPTLLNDMGITVLLQNNTTVLLRTSTVKLTGEIVHQEKFADGLSYIHVEDNGTPRQGAGVIQTVDTTRPYLRTQYARGNLKGQVALAARTYHYNLRKAAPAHRLAIKPPVWGVAYTASRSKFKLEANSWERWHAKLGHLNLTSLRIAAGDKVDLSGVTSASCECSDCLTTKVQSHPHEHGHAHLGGNDHKPGESMHMDNSGMFAWSLGNKRYRFLAVDDNTGFWANHHAAKKT